MLRPLFGPPLPGPPRQQARLQAGLPSGTPQRGAGPRSVLVLGGPAPGAAFLGCLTWTSAAGPRPGPLPGAARPPGRRVHAPAAASSPPARALLRVSAEAKCAPTSPFSPLTRLCNPLFNIPECPPGARCGSPQGAGRLRDQQETRFPTFASLAKPCILKEAKRDFFMS